MSITEPHIEDYLEKMTTPESEVLRFITRQTHLHQVYPRMISGSVQGKFLEMISRMIRPERILEIGTFTAYSTVCLSKGLLPHGTITTIEINPELEESILQHIEKAGIKEKVRLMIGDATQIISEMNESFDLVFIDADKEQYTEYFRAVLPAVRSGGFILADNVLWGGKVIDPEAKQDKETRGIIEFNEYIRSCQSVEVVILPLRDGISMIRKL